MKRTFRKITIALSIILTLTFSLALVGCCLDHDYEYVGNTYSSDDICTATYQCKKCGRYKREDTAHTYGSVVKVAATCTEPSCIYKDCSKCNHREYIPEVAETPALGHNYIIESGSGGYYSYGESSKCTRCGDPYYMLITTEAYISDKSSNYWTFNGTIYNRYKKISYVKAKLLIYDKNDRVIHTDWTYAVDSMPLEVGESTTFHLMIRRRDCSTIKYFRWEYYA